MTWRFAEFELDEEHHVLTSRGEPAKLSPQPFKALLLLVSRRGEIVRREELQSALWGEHLHVDFEHGLNTCLRQIRTALGETSAEPSIIETVPKIGYRVTVPVRGGDSARTRSVGIGAVTAIAAISLAVIAVGVTVALRGGKQPPDAAKLSARDLNTRAHLTLERQTPADRVAARQLFAQATQADPTSASAQAGLALTYLTTHAGRSGMTRGQGLALGRAALARAAALDPKAFDVQLAEAQAKVAVGDWPAAEREFERIVTDAPAVAAGHEAFAAALALLGRFDESLREGQRARELDPLSAHAATIVADTLRFARRYDEGKETAEAALRLDPTYGPAYHTLGLCYEALGDLDRAIESYLRSGRASGNLGHAYAAAGRIQEAQSLLSQFEEQYGKTGGGAAQIAQIYVGLREYDHAFEWLQRTADEGKSSTTLKVADVWDPLRSDPRFAVLLAKFGFE
jgi:DNA-binding winged helix-turn-helix (wHTH) protein/tetratricopeptide (TPR) repeat protein